MKIFRRARSRSPSIPRLCLPKDQASQNQVDNEVSLASRSSSLSTDGEQERSMSFEASTLVVPVHPRGRSSSFDASSLRRSNQDNKLQVPTYPSVDGSTSEEECNATSKEKFSLKVPGLQKYYRRRSLDIPKICIHCVHLESLSSREQSPISPQMNKKFAYKDFFSSDSDNNHSDLSSGDESGTTSETGEDDDENEEGYMSPANTDNDNHCKKNTFAQYKTVKQFAMSAESSRLGITRQFSTWGQEEEGTLTPQGALCHGVGKKSNNTIDSPFGKLFESSPNYKSQDKLDKADEEDSVKTVVTLEVPLVKPRSSSVDVTYLSPKYSADNQSGLLKPLNSHSPKSSSIDVSLPTDESNCYKAITTSPRQSRK